MQSSVLVALLVVAVACVSANQDSLLSYVPHNYLMFLGDSHKSDLSKLSWKDVAAAKKLANQVPQMTSAAQLKEAAQKASPNAYAIAAKYAHAATQYASQRYHETKQKLSPSSQHFFGELASMAREYGNKAVQLLKKQDAATKANLQQVFPASKKALKTPAGQALVKNYF